MAIEIAPPILDLAEGRKRRHDMRALWRLSAWGCAAAVALAALAITTQTEGGSERLAMALAPANPPVLAADMAELKRRALEKDAETKRLETQVATLAADRDRLVTQLSRLERSLDDMTGSIKRQAAVAPPSPSTLAMPAATAPPAPPPAQSGTPMTEPVPLPPVRMASAPANEAGAEAQAKLEFGIDLGGASTLDVLAARWSAVKANFGPLLTGLHPLAAHDSRPGSTAYRLVVGPVANPAAAMQLCTRFAAARVTCRATKFDGEQLAQR
jgi:hypothetical protein